MHLTLIGLTLPNRTITSILIHLNHQIDFINSTEITRTIRIDHVIYLSSNAFNFDWINPFKKRTITSILIHLNHQIDYIISIKITRTIRIDNVIYLSSNAFNFDWINCWK